MLLAALLVGMAPVAGAVVSFLALTWIASLDRKGEGIAPVAQAEPVLQGSGDMTVEEAVAFQEYPVFWVGPDFNGMPITSVDRMKSSLPPEVSQLLARPVPDTDSLDIVYGDCTPTGTPPTCVLPLQIQSTPYCLRPASLAAPEVLEGEPFELRGATAQWVGPGRNTLVLYTGESTVTIIATAGEATALEMAQSLYAANGLGPLSRGERLGPVTVACP
jgi:hypothetical protein